jgi:predicted enzyme related to lactoylglutathione lyase
MDYTLFSAGETGVGGLQALPAEACADGAWPGWIGYVAVDDVDAAAARFQAEGGKVRRAPGDIPDVGRFAIVADPQGAVLALFKPAGDPPPARVPVAAGTAGHGGWHELYAGDGPTAFEFYARQFGWTKADAMDMGPMGVYQLFAQGGVPIGGMMTKPAAMPAPAWQFYFNVDAADAALARVKAGGGEVLMGPQEVPGGSWIVQGRDPQGAAFALVAPKR